MKKILINLLFTSLLISSNLSAEEISKWNSGYLERIYIDTSDIVLKLGKPESSLCGTNLYHIQRTSENFNEFYSMALGAITSNKSISVKTEKCSGKRNIISHGYISNT